MNDPRIAYREASVRGASAVQLVIRLYEQIIEDLRHAMKAIEQSQIELRTKKINHAILVIAHLQSQLNVEAGAEPARHLSRFYDSVRSGLVRAQFRGSKELLAQQITDLMEVRSSWLELDRREQSTGIAAVNQTQTPLVSSEPARASWKA
jgi:flagellar secretion chaperone FliS